MSGINLRDIVDVAVEAAYLGGRRTLAYFNAGVDVEIKADQSPVTRADRESEEIIRARILRAFPSHSILGEEKGEVKGDPEVRWIVDPIDGTKSFIRGVPLYTTLIGVEVKGKPTVGVIYVPALDEMVWGAVGMGCWWNGRSARVSNVNKIEAATLLTSSYTGSVARSDAFEKLAKRAKFTGGWGDAYGYLLVATGRADIMIDPVLNPWDMAALAPVLSEAGGRFTNWLGEETIWGKDGVGTNGILHSDVVEVLRKG